MQVGTLNIQRLFGREVHYVVPLYQRPYVWSEAEQWRPFWDDLYPLAEQVADAKATRAHFMGASVQEPIAVPAGATETRLVIDGQQRLTTVQLLLKAFHDVVAARGIARHAGAINKLLFNDDPLIVDLQMRLKLRPTLADQSDYQLVMDANSPADLLQKLATPRARYPLRNHNIANAYAFFFGEIESWLGIEGDQIEDRVAGLYGAIRDHLRLVVIDLDEKDDAQAIFETLNARGAPLLSADLVKNALLSELSPADAEDAYRRYWQSFDNDGAFWRELVGRGHTQRARIETFLQHALTLLTGQPVSAGHLYNAYRDYAALETSGSVIDRLTRLRKLGDIFKRLNGAQDDARLADFFYRYQVLDVVTAWPFILTLYDQFEDRHELIRTIMIDLDSYLVRRMVCRLNTRGYGTTFASLTGVANDSGDDILKAVRSALLKGEAETDRWPDDAEFREAWTTFPLYQNLSRPRVRFLLEAMEQHARGSFSEEATPPRNLTIEHVMPQGWRENWAIMPGGSADERNRIVHTLGNLTLLTRRFNTYQSNRPWIDGAAPANGKRQNLSAHSVLALNRPLCEKPQWTEAEIAERAAEMFKVAQQIWPRPACPT